jgi:signal transduction histidine kinase
VEGSGLGLSIAKWIAEMHRADLSVPSSENKGTTIQGVFSFCEARQQTCDKSNLWKTN